MLNKIKVGITMVALGNLLYIVNMFFTSNGSSFQDFISGLLLGLSISINLVGIVLISFGISKLNS